MRHCCHEHQLHCVCKTVKRINEAQKKAAYRKKIRCIGCEQSINDLLHPKKKTVSDKTTIPFILYNQKGKPFIAKSVDKSPIECHPDTTYYKVVKTPFLKVRHIDPDSCCAHVELLRPVNANKLPVANCAKDFEDFFNEKTPFKTIHLQETGICLTLDLTCFCGILCLDAIHPVPKSSHFSPLSS